MGIREDTFTILSFLATFEQMPGDSKRGRYSLSGDDLHTGTKLDPDGVNDAVAVLEQNGFVETEKYLGTSPYDFGYVELTARGRVEAEQIVARPSASPQPKGEQPKAMVAISPNPIGSPFGFQDEDWELVEQDKSDATRVIVVLGHQWESKFFATDELRSNIEKLFLSSLQNVLAGKHGSGISLDYRPLQGGYGGHVFNEIARAIIGADIAVFETSDLNPNVMIELGVALTWGVRCLPIRERSSGKPPSDISGQTWAEYTSSGLYWTDPSTAKKIDAMIERVIRKKAAVLARPSHERTSQQLRSD